MKYTINHTQLIRFIDVYLSKTEYILLGGEYNGELVLLQKGTDDSHDFIYTYEDEKLYVETNIVNAISNIFTISVDDTLNYIGKWFANKYKVNVFETINWY